MNAFIIELLQAIATAAIPVCAAYLVQYLHRKSEHIIAQTDNMTIKAFLAEATDAVSTAVTYTSQTFVDALKKEGNFNKDKQQEALKKSLDKAISLLSEPAKNALTDIYGNLEAYLTSKIEAEVRSQKTGTLSLANF
ncbi:MAG: hypothetical protein HFG19_09545 [Oscillospiraceae bacterium]|nr:hypothetical protein [Oscillospiraceae bacterium]